MRLALVEQDGRVAQVEDIAFDVSPSLRWIPCPENVVAGLWRYDGSGFVEIPRPSGVVVP
jgi:hypothetical protein